MAGGNERNGYVSGLKANAQIGAMGRKDEKKTQSFDSQKKKDESKNGQQSQYGAWGPLYKNKQNFTNMHIC